MPARRVPQIERKHAMLLSPVQGSTFYFGQIMGSGLTKLKMSARSPQKTSLYKHWWRQTENHLTCWQINNCTPVCLYPWHQWCSPVPMNETFLKKEKVNISLLGVGAQIKEIIRITHAEKTKQKHLSTKIFQSCGRILSQSVKRTMSRTDYVLQREIA